MIIYFITGNQHKLEVARNALKGFPDITLEARKVDECPEIQSAHPQEVAKYSAQWCANHLNLPVVKADSGFYIDVLKGFPGPFVKYVNEWLAPSDLLSLMSGKETRSARFIDVVAYCEPGKEPISFQSETHGVITEKIAGEGAWGVDSVFIPNGYSKTLNEMSKEERIGVWDTKRWTDLAEFLVSQSK